MKSANSMATVLACVFSLDAQITTTLNRLPSGLNELRIRNNSENSLVAFVLTVKQVPLSPASSTAPFVIYSDPLVQPEAKPLLPGEERVVIARHHPSGMRLLEEPIVAAGVLADGATTGDATLLARLVLRRSNMLLAVETAMETLSDAGARNIPREQLIKQFTKMANSVNRWYLPPEQQVGRDLYQSIAGKLTNLPEGQPGSAFPPSSFVEQETAALNRRRVTLLESQPSLVDAALISAR